MYEFIVTQNSDFDTLFLLDQSDDFAQVADDRFQFRDRFGGEVLRVGEVVARFRRLVLQPGDVELVRPLGNLGRVEATEPLCFGSSGGSPALPSNRQLSGNTIEARPPGFNALTTCCTKLSCLLLVSMVKLSRFGA